MFIETSSSPTQPETCLVTGVAGFIGSHVAEALIAQGYHVRGVDAFVDFYPRVLKEGNLSQLRQAAAFQLIEADLRAADLGALLTGVDYVFHLAAQAGVRTSWGQSFAPYVEHNVLATQRLLEAARLSRVRRVIYASSSSVYGNAATMPAREDGHLLPLSPYGVTKLAGEHLCQVYAQEQSVPTISLRYFTVYGPRQRPDMAFHRFIRALLQEEPITIYGNGEQSRDFTYIGDIVAATLAAMRHGRPGACYNLGGGVQVTVNEVVSVLEQMTGKRARVSYQSRQRGDVAHTVADTTAARTELGFAPAWTLTDGLSNEVTWLAEQLARPVDLLCPQIFK
jgi:UDP-glucose 4-epimerase